MRRASLAVAVALACAGCTVGPDYVRPDLPEVPAGWAAGTGAPVQAEAVAPDLAWWRALGDARLVRYVEAAAASNQDVAIATARVREARALWRVAGADALPQAGAAAVGRRAALSETGGGPGSEIVEFGVADRRSSFFQALFDARWELDLFGGTRRATEAAGARLQAAEDQRRGVLLSVAAEVARNYVELRGAQRRQALAERNVRIQREVLALVQSRHRAGLAPELEVAQATRQLELTRAGVPPLRSAARAAAHRLAVLLDRPPAALLDALAPGVPIPAPPDIVPVGLPSELLRRRPDLRAAERQLHAATAELGVAIARLYPRFSLTGSAGVESDTFSELFDAGSGIWSFGPDVAWPVFQGGALRGGVEARRARLAQAKARYRQAVLRAWEEVESALVAYAETRLERDRLDAAAVAARRALKRARVRYDKGLSDLLPVLDAEAALTAIEDRLAARETAVVTRLIALYKALGGGWAVLAEDIATAGSVTTGEDAGQQEVPGT